MILWFPQPLLVTTYSHVVQGVQRNLADEWSAAQVRSVDIDRRCAALDAEVAWRDEALQDRFSQLEESRAAFVIQTQQLEQAMDVLKNNVPTPGHADPLAAQAAWFASEVHCAHIAVLLTLLAR
jgi:hypothetical protein